MDFAKIDVEVRNQTGKGAARRARAAGKVPAILYGHKAAPVPLALDPLALLRSMDKQKRRNTVFTLNMSEGGKAESVMAMIRDAQLDPLSRKIEHVDFIRVSLDEEVRVTVPLLLKGSPVGVVNGGTLHQSVHELRIAAKPDAIPTVVEVDVSGLDVNEALHVSDLKLGEGVRALLHAEDAIASVFVLREKAEAAPAAAEAAAPGATPAAGAAPAAAGKEEPKKDAKK